MTYAQGSADLGRSDARVTVVMPTYNEAANLPRIAELVLGQPVPRLRLMVVDDSSPDGTGRLAEELAEKYNADLPDGERRMSVLHRVEKDGLGRAYAAGMSAAVAEGAAYVVQMDADGSHPAEALPRMLAAAEESGAGLVIGSRYVEGGSLDEEWGWHRKALSRFANGYARTVLGTRQISDLTAGFTMWRADVLAAVDVRSLDSAGYSFQVELKYKAVRGGCEVVEVPIRFEERTEGESKMSLATQVESAMIPLRLRRRYRGL
ncbi:polyprenol monophosphomannose synthase [Streptomyces sp. NPDC050400]|uniref:polyprenol monophosphomannose synthase n=1 Tax=Streptomyces sp. NPDC050400 TaxID=3365610 RepID=UPI0037B09735